MYRLCKFVLAVLQLVAAKPPTWQEKKTYTQPWLLHPPPREPGMDTCDQFFGKSLKQGVQRVLAASEAELMDEVFVRDVVREVGLFNGACPWCSPKAISPAYYGKITHQYRVTNPFYVNRAGLSNDTRWFPTGMWQIPEQFACAMILLSKFQITSVLTIGTFSGWTDCIMFSYFKRLADLRGLGTFKALTSDNWDQLTPCVREIMAMSGFEFEARGSLNADPLKKYRAVKGSGKIDFCFIDGDHSEIAITTDMRTYGAACRHMMLHDIILVKHLFKAFQENAKRLGKTEHQCVHSATTTIARMGIGLLLDQAELAPNR